LSETGPMSSSGCCGPSPMLGIEMRVASLEDVLQGKIWAAASEGRRPSKRQKDLFDIARLVEAFPELRERIPEDVLRKLPW